MKPKRKQTSSVQKYLIGQINAICNKKLPNSDKAQMVCQLASQERMFQFLDSARNNAETAGQLTQLQKEYQAFFLELLTKYGVTSPAELDDKKKMQFFDEIRDKWATGDGVSKNKMVKEPKEGEGDGEGNGGQEQTAARGSRLRTCRIWEYGCVGKSVDHLLQVTQKVRSTWAHCLK